MRYVPMIAACLVLAACSTAPKTTAGLADQMPLKPAENDAFSGTLTYRSPDVDVHAYRGIYVLPAKVYDGADAEWGETDPATRQRIADKLTAEYQRALRQHGRNVLAQAVPGSVTLELTLAGVTSTNAVAANAIKLTPVGMGLTLVKSAAGLPASFTGSITVAGKLTDSRTGAVVAGFMVRESPTAIDPRSLGGTEDTAMLAVSKSAESFADVVDRVLKARK